MTTIQQVLFIETDGHGLRSQAIGWTCEDPSIVVPGKPIAYTPGVQFAHAYNTPLEAMADGWKLLGLPERDRHYATWLLVREIEKPPPDAT